MLRPAAALARPMSVPLRPRIPSSASLVGQQDLVLGKSTPGQAIQTVAKKFGEAVQTCSNNSFNFPPTTLLPSPGLGLTFSSHTSPLRFLQRLLWLFVGVLQPGVNCTQPKTQELSDL